MTARVSDVFARRPARSGPPEQSSVLAALAVPLFVVDGDGHFSFANQAAEQFFDSSTANLLGRPLRDMLPEARPIFGLIPQVRQGGSTVSEYAVTIANPKIRTPLVSTSPTSLPPP